MKRKYSILSVLCVLLVALLCACGGAEDTENTEKSTPDGEVQTVPDHLTLAYNTTDGIDPISCSSEENRLLSQLCYEKLFEADENYIPQPKLCKSMEKTDDREYTLTIKKGVHFHSGKELTAEDVVYSLNEARKRDSSIYAKQLGEISSVKEEDGKVVIRLYHSNASLPSLLNIPIIREEEDAEIPDGTGPFRLTQTGDSYLLEAFENWNGGKISYCSSIDVVPVPDTMDTQNLFSSAEITLLMKEDAEDMSVQGARYIYSTAGTRMHFLGINCDMSPYDSAKVRQALALLLDRDSIVESCLSDRADAAALPVRNIPEGTEAPSYREEEALRLLRSADIRDDDEDGVLEIDGGREFTVELIYNETYRTKGAVLEQYAQTLRKAGILSEIKPLSYDDCRKELRRESFQIYYGELRMTPDFDASSLFSDNGDRNFSGYYNKKLERSLTALRLSDSDEEYQKMLRAYLERFSDEMPIIPIAFERRMLYSVTEMPKGFEPWPDNVFHGIENWKK